jgi:hypothetical protein
VSIFRSRWAPALAALPGIAALFAHWAVVRPAFVDDSYIFYRYAENWADGLGLVFNRGEDVEGYSSFLWTALLALAHVLGASLPTAAPVLGLVAGAGCLVIVAYAARSMLDNVVLAAVTALAVALCTGFAFYAANGMDAVFFALVLTGTAVLAAVHVELVRRGERPPTWLTAVLCAALVVLALSRAEGFAYALLMAAAAYWLERRAGRASLAPPVAAVAATVLVFVVRQLVYGALLPATVSAKGYFSHVLADGDLHAAGSVIKNGLEYEGVLVLAALVLIAIAVVLVARRERRLPALVTVGGVAVALNTAVTVLNSGDWMPSRRLLVPALPLLVLLAAWAADALADRLSPRLALGAPAAVLACVLVVLGAGFDPKEGPKDQPLFEIGRALGATRPPARVLTNVAGVIPYYAGPDAYVWDMLGLTDEHNARHGQVYSPRYGRTDPAYDFSRDFDVFVTNAPRDPALMVRAWTRTPEKFGRFVVFAPSRWAAQSNVYVFARRDSAAEDALAAACGCKGRALTPRVRSLLVARAKAAGAPSGD